MRRPLGVNFNSKTTMMLIHTTCSINKCIRIIKGTMFTHEWRGGSLELLGLTLIPKPLS